MGTRVDRYAQFSLPTKWNKGRVYFWSMWKSADESVHSTSCFHGALEYEEDNLSTDKEKTTAVKNIVQATESALNSSVIQQPENTEEEQLAPPITSTNQEDKSTTKEELKTKKSTPPGYIRMVNKQIIKQSKESENKTYPNQVNEKLNNEPRPILEMQDREVQQNE